MRYSVPKYPRQKSNTPECAKSKLVARLVFRSFKPGFWRLPWCSAVRCRERVSTTAVLEGTAPRSLAATRQGELRHCCSEAIRWTPKLKLVEHSHNWEEAKRCHLGEISLVSEPRCLEKHVFFGREAICNLDHVMTEARRKIQC